MTLIGVINTLTGTST